LAGGQMLAMGWDATAAFIVLIIPTLVAGFSLLAKERQRH